MGLTLHGNVNQMSKTMLQKETAAALFDFDGTITRNDSLIDFIRFMVGPARFFLGFFLMSPMLVFYKLGLIPNYRAKRMLLSHFFKGVPEDRFKEQASDYALSRIDGNVRARAMERLEWHREQGHRIIVVSASMESWLQAWCKRNRFELIATRLEFANGIVTGGFATRNCHGREKVRRLEAVLDLSSFDTIYAYGDSNGDRELLEIAHRKFYKPFR